MKLKTLGLILTLSLLNVCAYAGGPKGRQIVKVIGAVRVPPAPVIGLYSAPALQRATAVSAMSTLPHVTTTLNMPTGISNMPGVRATTDISGRPMLPTNTGASNTSVLPQTVTISNVQAPQKILLPGQEQKAEVLVVNPKDLLKKSPFDIEARKAALQLTDLSFPEIAKQLDRLMQRHPEILKNPQYGREDRVKMVNLPTAPYTADQIAMVAALENQPQWTWYAGERAGLLGNSVYYALKNGHGELASWILKYYDCSINDALYEALVLGDMAMAEQIYSTYNVDVDKTTLTLEQPLLVRMSEKSTNGVNWLLAHGADPVGNHYLYPALDNAIQNGQTDVIEILHQLGADLSLAFQHSSVFFYPQCVEKLIALGVPVNGQIVDKAFYVQWAENLTPEEKEAAETTYNILWKAFHEQTVRELDRFIHRTSW